MEFHPRDTVDIYERAKNQPFDHLWYKVHYFQQKSYRESEANKRLKDLQESITPSKRQGDVFDKIRRRRYEALALMGDTSRVMILHGTPSGRMVHGLGAGHVRETSITLHAVYGVPYIPGSSIKGIVQHWALQAFFNGKEDRFKKALDERQQAALVMNDLFGTQTSQGIIQFHDAFVRGNFFLKPDVITVHYGDYYQGNKPATDNMHTVPNGFYTVTDGIFEFILTQLYDIRGCASGLAAEQLLDIAATWLRLALTEFGIGAKTSSGYGFFRELTDVTNAVLNPVKENLKRKEAKKQEALAKKREEEEEKRRQALLEERLNNMSEAERLAYEIEQLSDSQEDQDKSKSVLYEQVIAHAEQGELTPAKALKTYWERIGSWKVKKKARRQYGKVQTIKTYLDDES
ncbi:type III-B CRISPR module RAMP protein Cmr6 [Novibacillus thermophilus]|uniref:Type III-B CRISPR module RAMP protein Cmr6 n=1 Tax=Novibacillus thermophilus TaxID=1471761 RepID=A0A1U9K7T1_9BACL|nr:type III-B CRISPR module RAMP protein Cmr6 [Novibacillus thermophilus]AQS56080.1 type III-B CRISPR module RAMP protein Cmr6 [Novibacillus thermophilus]